MDFGELVGSLDAVRQTRSRKQKIAHLAACLSGLDTEELPAGVGFLAGELRQGRIGIGAALVREVWNQLDDPPVVATGRQPLSLLDVDRALTELAGISGAGSKAKRVAKLNELCAPMSSAERDLTARLLVGEVRQGALEALLIEALAEAAELEPAAVRRAVMLGGSLVTVGREILVRGEPALEDFKLEVGRAVQPMLTQSAGSVAEAAERLGGIEALALEWKHDGVRLQIHKLGRAVQLFTRQLFDVSKAAPEVVSAVRAWDVERCIVDAEAVAFDGARPRPFQETMRRFGRRLDVERMARELPLTLRAFDILQAEERELLDAPNAERHAVLENLLPADQRIERKVVESVEEGQEFFGQALAAGHEGIVAKALKAPYDAGRRGAQWIKVKPAHTLDLVVLAAKWGSGRRKGWLSNLHLGARGTATQLEFVMLGKTFKGLTDEILSWQTERLLELETRRETGVVFVRPELVVEVACDGVQRSPHYLRRRCAALCPGQTLPPGQGRSRGRQH